MSLDAKTANAAFDDSIGRGILSSSRFDGAVAFKGDLGPKSVTTPEFATSVGVQDGKRYSEPQTELANEP